MRTFAVALNRIKKLYGMENFILYDYKPVTSYTEVRFKKFLYEHVIKEFATLWSPCLSDVPGSSYCKKYGTVPSGTLDCCSYKIRSSKTSLRCISVTPTCTGLVQAFTFSWENRCSPTKNPDCTNI